MKTTTPFKRRLITVTILLALFFSLLFTVHYLHRDERSLHKLTRQLFTAELTANTLNMHYTVADPARYGIRSYAPVLPSYSLSSKQQSILRTENNVELLRSLNPSRLHDEDLCTYNLLLPYLANELQGARLFYYAEPLSPSSGMQSQLPILLAEYAFRTQRDVEDYLSLLDQTDDYFAGLIAFEQEKAAKGLFMPDYSADKVIEQCSAIMDPASLKDGVHFLDTTFAQRLAPLVEKGVIDERKEQAFLAENDRLLTTVMLPAYTKLADELLLLKGSGQNQEGLSHYPEGKDYYRYLLRANTCSHRDISEIKQLLYDDFTRSFDALVSLSKNHPDLTSALAAERAFLYDSPEDMLNNLQKMMAQDFPPFSSSPWASREENRISCSVKTVSENLEKYCSPAFYLTPPMDDMKDNVIYINEKNNPSGLNLYTTLAHEGYPGHLYQTVYSQQHMRKEKADPVRNTLFYGGYVEGWAMYVELLSYDYAKQLMQGIDPSADYVYEAYRLNRCIQLCLYSLLDIAIHDEGATPEQVGRILSSVGISSPETTRAIYEYIVEEPATYPKYYVGYLEILSLKERAKELWGKDFTPRRFHQFFLENGPADFEHIRRELERTSAPMS